MKPTTSLYLAATALCLLGTALTASPQENAAEIYVRASSLIIADSPNLSPQLFPDYPPYGQEWERIAQMAWEKDAPMRELVRQARSSTTADWENASTQKFAYLNAREVADVLGDAALYQHLHGDDSGAFESIRDMLHLADLLRCKRPPQSGDVVQWLVAAGIDAMTDDRTLVITSQVKLTNAPADAHALQCSTARQVITIFLHQYDPKAEFAAVKNSVEPLQARFDRLMETFLRCNADRTFAAISLACHLYQFDHHRWPTSLDDLIPAYLPQAPIDPWGDGHQTFGYALVNGNQPDTERPLVYSRCNSRDGLFYRLDRPFYGFYTGDGSDRPPTLQKQGGEFRDVTMWQPAPLANGAPTTRPLD